MSSILCVPSCWTIIAVKINYILSSFVYLADFMDSEPEVNPYLDALVDLLDADDEDEVSINDRQEDQNPASPGETADRGNVNQLQGAVIDNNGQIQNHSPRPQNRTPQQQQLNRYLSSSSARRRVVKQTHCRYCIGEYNREDFEEHLLRSQNCLTLYLRSWHLKTLEAVLLKIFPCFYCDNHFRQLKHHLRTQPNCFQQFKERFNVETISGVMRKIENLRKEDMKSRRSLARHFENEKAKENKKRNASEIWRDV